MPVEVAVGVVFDAQGRVLLGQRPAGKPYAGWWEFPGGKLEAGETVAAALARELREELGLAIHGAQPWIIREFVYPHAHVRLHFQRVTDFSGEPQSLESQAFAWCDPQAVTQEPLLPATVPVLDWLRLPSQMRPGDPSLASGRACRTLAELELAAQEACPFAILDADFEGADRERLQGGFPLPVFAVSELGLRAFHGRWLAD